MWILIASLFYEAANAQGNGIDYSRLLQIPRHYTILKTSEKITVDGKDEEKDWNKAPWTPAFANIETGEQTNPERATKCKMLWNNDFLYLFVKMKERDLWASIRNHDDLVFHDNAFEVFMAPEGGTYNYFEFQINGFGTVWDLFLPKPYRNGGKGQSGWDIKGLEKAVYLDGTLNNPADTDRGWNVELAIPFNSVKINGNQSPTIGTIWRMNFSRVEWQLDTLNGAYFKKKDKVKGRSLPEDYSVWSPQGIINLHYPERWGYVLFSNTLSTKNFLSTEDEKLKLLLWKYYYLQQEFKKQNERYATALEQLDKLYKGVPGLTANKSYIKMFSDEQQFRVQVFLPSLNKNMSVSDQGQVHFEDQKNK